MAAASASSGSCSAAAAPGAPPVRFHYSNITTTADGSSDKKVVTAVVELTSLWKALTGIRGDRSLKSTLNHLGDQAPEPKSAMFPTQTGTVKNKQMPCADLLGVRVLLSALDPEILEAKAALISDVLSALGAASGGRDTVVSPRFPKIPLQDGRSDSASLQMVVASADNTPPRFVILSLLQGMTNRIPTHVWPSVARYLRKCGVSIPDCLFPETAQECSEEPSGVANPCEYALALGARSRGVIIGTSPYNHGAPVALGDLPIFVLIVDKLQSQRARNFRTHALHQGVVLMGGNDQVAQSISQHWRNERKKLSTSSPLKSLLEFLSAAVDHIEATTAAVASAAASQPTAPVVVATPRGVVPQKRHRPAQLEDKKLSWTDDLGATREQVPLVKATFRQLLELEIAAGALPASARKDCSAPCRNQRSLAVAALESARCALAARTTMNSSDSSKKRKAPEAPAVVPAPPQEGPPEQAAVLRISEILQEAQVWKPVRKAIASDLSNRMLQLKTEATDGKFSTRRTQHLPSVPMDVDVHTYKKPEDVLLAEQTLRDVQPLYEKRIREFLEAIFSQFELLSAPVSAACTVAARRLADDLRLDLSGLLAAAQ